MNLPDPVPLGVSGSMTVPRAHYLARVGARAGQRLLNDDDRAAYVARRLAEALERPLTSPGSASLARTVLSRFPGFDPLTYFARKAIETLRDLKRHDTMVISPGEPRVGAWFVAWSGTHREVQSERYGNYLELLGGTALRIVDMGVPLAGFLEIDGYVRENPDPDDPDVPLDQVFEVDVELSFLPGRLLKYPKEQPNPFPKLPMLNFDLCTPEERQVLENRMA
jgi:hypothetical protein